ncbi:Crp/Fnr family transcriptional regulator [Seonamhaeicola maritimus]|uniref:Crp/Fnr family transcriptional regulator n=1 Tax=Seonamhaeicola maritimus TaxID=2591822 RepID=UPI0024952317|nr:Crp/Fnr family transcriptional regulator [Seonamhaeicola maritimus]
MNFNIEDFLKTGQTVSFDKYEHILHQGAVSNKVYFLIEGIVRHYVIDLQGNEKTIRLSKENDFFYSSNVSFWSGAPSYINCQPLTKVKLLCWTKEFLDSLIEDTPEFIAFENQKLKDFIIEKHIKEVAGITKNAEERLLEFNKSDKSLFNRIPHHVIASYLDMTPETLSRIRAKFRKQKS